MLSQEEQEEIIKKMLRQRAGKESRMVRWVMRLSGGKIQTERQANIVLVGFSLVVFTISIVLFAYALI